MPTVGRILELAPVADYLANKRAAKGGLFGPPLDPRLGILIYIVTKILKKIYDLDPTYQYVQQRDVADYLFELIRKYANQAAAIVDGNNGGQIATPTSAVSVDPYDFEVTDTSFISTGESSVYIPEFIGLNVNFRRNGVSQNTTILGDGDYYSWNKVTGLFTIYNIAQAGELFRIEPDNVGGAGTVTVIADGVFPFVVTSADFEVDMITLNDARLEGGVEYYLDVSGYSQEHQFEGVFFTYTATGFVVIAGGWQASDFGNIVITKINS